MKFNFFFMDSNYYLYIHGRAPLLHIVTEKWANETLPQDLIKIPSLLQQHQSDEMDDNGNIILIKGVNQHSDFKWTELHLPGLQSPDH
jgi:uncharacterized protein YacL (UPF0231 family)